MKPTLYIESTVISYYTARPNSSLVVSGHQKTTHDWWTKNIYKFTCVVSEFVIAEISRGDPKAARKRLHTVETFPILQASPQTTDLAEEYFKAIHIPEKAKIDAFHLAIAVLNGIDYLVSWNFSHIVNASVLKVIDIINEYRDLETPIICTPEFLMEF